MNPCRTLAICCVFAGLARAPAVAQQAPQLAAQSSFRLLRRTPDCTFGYQATSVRYLVVGATVVEEPDWPHLVLEEKTTLRQCENLEGPTEAEVSVAARPAAHPEARPRWVIRRRGDTGAVVDSFPGRSLYRVTEYGCCGSEDLDAYYSLVTGRELFTADHPLLFVDVKPFGTGFVAVHDVEAAGSPGAESDRTLVAVVAFGAPGATVQRAAVRAASTEYRVTRLELVARDPAGHLKRGPSLDLNSEIDARWSVAVSIDFEGVADGRPAGRVAIPIANGRMVVERATATAPFRVAAMPAR